MGHDDPGLCRRGLHGVSQGAKWAGSSSRLTSSDLSVFEQPPPGGFSCPRVNPPPFARERLTQPGREHGMGCSGGVPKFFQSDRDEAAWIMQHYFGATLWKGRPKFAVDPLPAMPSQEPQRTAEVVRRILPQLVRLYRYESRAVTRRDRAIRAIIGRCKY